MPGTGARKDGAELVAWDSCAGGWSALASNTASELAPAPIEAAIDDPQVLGCLLARSSLDVLVHPARGAGNGDPAQPPAVMLEHIAIRLSYRRLAP